jgi:hypothetical protein
MPNTETLIASLTAVGEHGAWYPGDDSDLRYMDWATRTPAGDYRMEVSDGENTAQFDLTRAELVALHTAITLTLLRDQT